MYGVSVLFPGNVELVVDGPIPFPRNVWGSKEGMDRTALGVSKVTDSGGEYSATPLLICNCLSQCPSIRSIDSSFVLF